MPTIKQNLTNTNYEANCNIPEWIVVHNVGTPSTYEGAAYANTQYFKNEYRSASAHYFIDEGNTIWQCVDDMDVAWAVGDSWSRNGCTNYNSISIEVCGDWQFTEKEILTLSWLVQHLMLKWGISADHVVRHYDCTTKNCPAYYTNDEAWNELKARITKEYTMGWVKEDTDWWWYQNEDGSYPYDEWKWIDGYCYKFDKSGYIEHGWVYDRGQYYFLYDGHDKGTFGQMAIDFNKIGGKWYFFRNDGVMMKDCLIQADDEKIYALDKDGVLITEGAVNIEVTPSGALRVKQD